MPLCESYRGAGGKVKAKWSGGAAGALTLAALPWRPDQMLLPLVVQAVEDLVGVLDAMVIKHVLVVDDAQGEQFLRLGHAGVAGGRLVLAGLGADHELERGVTFRGGIVEVVGGEEQGQEMAVGTEDGDGAGLGEVLGDQVGDLVGRVAQHPRVVRHGRADADHRRFLYGLDDTLGTALVRYLTFLDAGETGDVLHPLYPKMDELHQLRRQRWRF